MDMRTSDYTQRRGEIETYFDRTAAVAWARLTSDAPVSRIRATVRAGRERMRATLLSRLPADLRGQRVLDAGCGTGALAIEAARRGAEVIGIDLSPTLVALAAERLPTDLGEGSVRLLAGDMLDPALGHFDHVVAMDSLIHYDLPDVVKALAALAPRCRHRLLLTFAPHTFALAAMRRVGRLLPQRDRAPWITPVKEAALREACRQHPSLAGWQPAHTERVSSGFYTSQALELVRA